MNLGEWGKGKGDSHSEPKFQQVDNALINFARLIVDDNRGISILQEDFAGHKWANRVHRIWRREELGGNGARGLGMRKGKGGSKRSLYLNRFFKVVFS